MLVIIIEVVVNDYTEDDWGLAKVDCGFSISKVEGEKGDEEDEVSID